MSLEMLLYIFGKAILCIHGNANNHGILDDKKKLFNFFLTTAGGFRSRNESTASCDW